MVCDMCGRSGKMYKALIEGTQMTVCENCSRHGKVIDKNQRSTTAKNPRPKPRKPENVLVITEDYAKKIKDAREKMGLKQEDFAKKIAEKQSLLHNIESGHFEPNINLARKLEKFFNIKLVEQQKASGSVSAGSETRGLTLGDMMKDKLKR
ncbi:MAG: multiprotein bridging factor aMBF1 [Nanobdellota archaeon]